MSHTENATARALYAVYMASHGKNYQGQACPTWEKLPEAVQGHWATVAAYATENGLRSKLASPSGDALTVAGDDGDRDGDRAWIRRATFARFMGGALTQLNEEPPEPPAARARRRSSKTKK